MLHLLGFTPDNAARLEQFNALYQDGDVCVFTDAGLLLAASLPLKGDAYLLQHPQLALPDSSLPVIKHDQLIELIAEHGPCTSWY